MGKNSQPDTRPFYKKKRFYFLAFIILIVLSAANGDTTATVVCVCIIVFFLPLTILLLGLGPKNKIADGKKVINISLFGAKEKKEIERLKAMILPEQFELSDLLTQIDEAKNQLSGIQSELEKTREQLENKKSELIETDENVLLQSFGMYTPHYIYTTSDEYKEKIVEIRNRQKALIKSDEAVMGNSNWTVNGSKAQGNKMIKDTKKLLLRAYNAECDDAIEHVRFNNIGASEKKIKSSADAISKLGKIHNIHIKDEYAQLKIEELHLVHEYQVKKQEEKEAIKEARALEREKAKAQKELEEAREKLEKEQNHYSNELSRIEAQMLEEFSEDKLIMLNEKRIELKSRLNEIDEQIEEVDYRNANQKAGYVYVISNIGAFGENVFKIGMTRRLNPMDRIDELGDASVPFNFDVHALIFCEDAPKLEATLHDAFKDKKLNFVNHRREFFAVSIEEIKEVVHNNYDKTVEFVDVAPAEQYRQSLKLKLTTN